MANRNKSSIFGKNSSPEKSKSWSVKEENVLVSKEKKQNENSSSPPAISQESELETASTTSVRGGKPLVRIFELKQSQVEIPTDDKFSRGSILLLVSDIALFFVFSACFNIYKVSLQIDDVTLDVNYTYLSISPLICLLLGYVVNNFVRTKDISLILLYISSFCPLTYFIIVFPFTPRELTMALILSYAPQMTIFASTCFLRRIVEYESLKYPEQDKLITKFTFWLESCRQLGVVFAISLTNSVISQKNYPLIAIAAVPVIYYLFLLVQTFWMKLFGYTTGEKRIIDVYIKCICRMAVKRCSPTAHEKWKMNAIENYGQKTLDESNMLIAIFCSAIPFIGYGMIRNIIKKISLQFHVPHMVDYPMFRREYTTLVYETMLGLSLSIVQFISIPLCVRKVKGITKILIRNICCGYLITLISTLLCFILEIKITRMLGTLPGYEFAEFRIFNSLPTDVYLRSRLFDLKTIKGFEQTIFQNIPVNQPTGVVLFDSTVRLPETYHLKLSPFKCLVYVITANNTLNSIKYPVPLFRGPRGTNNLKSSRCFLFSPIKNLTGIFLVNNLNTSVVKKIKFPKHEDSSVFGIEPGHYRFTFIGTALDRKEINGSHIFPGHLIVNSNHSNGVYGILLHFPLNNVTHVVGKFYAMIAPLNLPYVSVIGQLFCLALGEAFMRICFISFVVMATPINCRAVTLSWLFFFQDCAAAIEFLKDSDVRPSYYEFVGYLCISVISVFGFVIMTLRFKLQQ